MLVSKVGLPRHDKKYYSSNIFRLLQHDKKYYSPTMFKLPQYIKRYNTQFKQSQESINTKASTNTYESIESKQSINSEKECSINSLKNDLIYTGMIIFELSKYVALFVITVAGGNIFLNKLCGTDKETFEISEFNNCHSCDCHCCHCCHCCDCG